MEEISPDEIMEDGLEALDIGHPLKDILVQGGGLGNRHIIVSAG